MSDYGLFGPESVTWRLHAESSMALAGLRALLLQALHPLAMAGVEQHSAYRTDPWGRLARTGEFIGVTTFGTTEQALRAGARVRGLHGTKEGVEPESGVRYRVSDPHLLLWVHCAQVDSVLVSLRAAGVKISKHDADRYVAEQVTAAELVGIDPGDAPTTVAELAACVATYRTELRMTAAGRGAVKFVLFPPMPSSAWVIAAKPAWATLASVAVALLPRWALKLYGMPGLPTTPFVAAAGARTFRRTTLLLPISKREGPMLKAARARLAEDGLHWTGSGVVPIEDKLAG
ncbi:MAG: oxygenase MpaB family protein [Actinomycetota bacterium]